MVVYYHYDHDIATVWSPQKLPSSIFEFSPHLPLSCAHTQFKLLFLRTLHKFRNI